MLRIERTRQFKRDYKRELKGHHRTTLEDSLVVILNALVRNQVLDNKHRDHALSGDWGEYRDCHVKPDLVLIYRKFDSKALQLVCLGSHSELGL